MNPAFIAPLFLASPWAEEWVEGEPTPFQVFLRVQYVRA